MPRNTETSTTVPTSGVMNISPASTCVPNDTEACKGESEQVLTPASSLESRMGMGT